ncbi:right-handed parallel beta-helix repeat-containing protein [Paenibacillus oryzisoli]|uniref:right-handed parallel beta-helix repeat-containing protein n=1 Tax=Paenibacillus oryzisoli TaxID=1850517 RepID=UPI003D287BCC
MINLRRKLLFTSVIFASVIGSQLVPHVTQADTPVTYYVSVSTGDDSYDGLSTQTAFKSIQRAADLSGPGDKIYVMNGTYYDWQSSSLLSISHSGTPTAYITFKAYPGHSPLLRPVNGAWNAISIHGAAYVNIEGFEIAGDTPNITLAQAQASHDAYKTQAINAKNPNFTSNCTITWNDYAKTNTNGIQITTAPSVPSNPNSPPLIPQHINIRNNKIHDMPGAGIAGLSGDYLTIENNLVYGTSKRTFFATSGISLLKLTNWDTNTDTSFYKNYVRNNTVYDNRSEVGWADKEIEKGLYTLPVRWQRDHYRLQ